MLGHRPEGSKPHPVASYTQSEWWTLSHAERWPATVGRDKFKDIHGGLSLKTFTLVWAW